MLSRPVEPWLVDGAASVSRLILFASCTCSRTPSIIPPADSRGHQGSQADDSKLSKDGCKHCPIYNNAPLPKKTKKKPHLMVLSETLPDLQVPLWIQWLIHLHLRWVTWTNIVLHHPPLNEVERRLLCSNPRAFSRQLHLCHHLDTDINAEGANGRETNGRGTFCLLADR